ncbi:MAG: hypothetical protein WAV51_00265 [Microgenomates group bacterium]
MTNKTVRIISITLLLLSLGLWSAIIIPSFLKEQQTTTNPTQEILWQEEQKQLSEIEIATMSASFTEDFEKNLALASATPTPTPFFTSDIPASMAGDLNPPTVTIQGNTAEGATITGNSVCFPLWVSDNMTPWQRLQTRSKLDTNQWSVWMETFSYCFQNLGNGKHTFSVQIRDLAGNVASPVARTFLIRQ